MANDPDDLDALLADVERSLSGGGASGDRAPARRGSSTPQAPPAGSAVTRRGVGSSLAVAIVTAAVIAVLVGVLAFFVPLFGVWSATVGAFIGALLAGIVARLTR